jgi:predicted phage tail protein
MKLTPSRRKFLDFMSGSGGRFLRGGFGVVVIVAAASLGGWYWLLAPLGVFMIGTGVVNYCPATLAFPQYKGEKMIDNYPTYKLKK